MDSGQPGRDDAPFALEPEASLVRLGWGDSSPSVAIAEGVAAIKKVDQSGLEPLYASLDPDALDGLLASLAGGAATPDLSVVFSYAGCRVRAHDDGFDVVVEDDAP